jgi:uncharacterized protein involved in type VI secretion and phage assembly
MDGRTNGILIGVVTNLDDPDNLGRVKVRFPCLADQESDWSRIATLMAGPERGIYFRPEVEDEVLVAFEQGDPRRTYVLGCLWNMQDKPPKDIGPARENDKRLIRSRSGHQVTFDDTKGSELIKIADSSGNNTLVFDTVKNEITLIAQQKVTVQAESIEVKGKTSVKVEAPTIEMSAQTRMTLNGGSQMTLQAGVININ